jgi:hypothetical protein
VPPFIFIHIPRTAGRMILHAVGKTFDFQHKTIADYCAELTEPVVRRRFVFAVVRNPWERAVSWYLFFGLQADPYKLVPFADWVVKRDPAKHTEGEPVFPFDQMSFCRNSNGEVLIDTFMRFESLDADFVPVAERLGVSPVIPDGGRNEKMEAARQREAMYDQFQLPRIDLVSIAKDYRSAYATQASIDAVARLEQGVIDRFGYDFSPCS